MKPLVFVVALLGCSKVDPLASDLTDLRGTPSARTAAARRIAHRCCRDDDGAIAERACDATKELLDHEPDEQVLERALFEMLEGCPRMSDEPIITLLRTRSVSRMRAIEVLRDMGPTSKSIEYFIEHVTDRMMFNVLACLGDRELEALAARANDPSEKVRMEVASVLARATVAPISSEKVNQSLIHLAQDPDRSVAMWGETALQHYRDFDENTADEAVAFLLDPERRSKSHYLFFGDVEIIQLLSVRNVFCKSAAATTALETFATKPETQRRAKRAIEARTRRCSL